MAKAAKKKTADLFDEVAETAPKKGRGYTAKDIEVLEGLEPVRKRPGMYIGGTDERALHHLAAEVLDNAMDEAVSGHADRIEISLADDATLTVTDNGRGIPVDPHPKFKSKSALEVILTTLHSGGKFGDKVYQTVIPRNVRVSEAPSHGKPVLLYDYRCTGSRAYMHLAGEVLRPQLLAERRRLRLVQLVEAGAPML